MTSLMVLKQQVILLLKKVCFSSMTSLMVLKHYGNDYGFCSCFSSMTSLMVLKLEKLEQLLR